MLYVGNGESAQTRVQGAFLSDQEVQDELTMLLNNKSKLCERNGTRCASR